MISFKHAANWNLFLVIAAALAIVCVPACRNDEGGGNQTNGGTTNTNVEGQGHSHDGGSHGHSHTSETQQDDPASEIGLNPETSIDDLLVVIRSVDKTRAAEALLQLAMKKVPDERMEEVALQIARSCLDADELTRIAAEQAVMEIGQPVADNIGELMTSREPLEYGAGCSAVRYLGPKAKQWLPQLIEGLNHPDATVRRMALFGLDNFGIEAAPALDRLIELLDDTDFNNQVGVCQVLEDMGIDAAPAEEKLLNVVEEGNLSARSWALIALGSIGPTPDTDVGALLAEKLNAYAQVEKERALMGLAHLGTEASDHLEKIEAIMTDDKKRCQPWAAYTYWKVSGDAEKALAILEDLLDNETYRRGAIDMLTRMGPDAADAAVEIVRNLEGAEPDVIESSVIALQKFGSGAADQIDGIKPYLEYDDPLIRFHTRKAIAIMSAENE